MSIDPNQTLHIKSGVKVDDTLTTAQKLGIGTEAPSAAAHVYGTGAGAAVVVQESTVNSGVARVDVVDKTVRIQAGLTPSNDSKANVEISSYGGATKYVEIDTVTGGPRGNVHVNADLRAPNVYAETLYIESLAIGEVTQGFDEVLNTNNEAANTIYVSNSTAATSLTTGAVRVVGGIATQGNVYADAVYTANLFSTTDELNLSSDVVKLGNKIELGYGNAENTDHNIGVLMTARQQFWSNVATADIASPQTSSAGNFGYSVSVSRDGDRFVAGSHATGHAYVYHRDPLTGTWPSTPTATFTAPNASTHFGLATLISPDGTRAFVGARLNDEGGSNIGRAYAYSYENGLWNTTPVDLPGQYAGEQMGWSLACNEDGTVVAVGARFNDEGGTDYGRVYVFEETSGNWNTTPIIDIPGTTTDEEFGVALDMNDAGTRLVVGPESTSTSGAAYVFHKTNGTWPTTATATLTGKGVAADLFGSAVKMNATGTRIVVAARGGDYARVYQYDTSTSAWNTTHVAEFSSPKLGDLFGLSCAMNDAGDRVAIGARYGGLEQQGTVTVYEEVNGAWREAHRFYGHEASAYLGGGLTGVSFNGTGDILVAGAIGYEDAVGRVYVFEQIAASNVAAVYDGHDTLKIGFTSNVVTDAVVDTNASNLHVEIAGDLTLSGSANVFLSNASAIHANSNVVTEFRASKKLLKYPRVAMTQNDESSTTGYVASGTGEVSTGGAGNYTNYYAFLAFNNIFGINYNAWHSGADYSSTTGAYTGTIPSVGRTSVGGNNYDGHYIQLQLPHNIKLSYLTIRPQYDTSAGSQWHSRLPKDFIVFGSNDPTEGWIIVKSITGVTGTESSDTIVNIDSSDYYQYYRLLITKNGGNTFTTIGELAFYGIPETDDDPGVGTDVIARSIPSVPNTDWLEVYYDGQDYGSMPSTITDKSGNGVTGTPSGVTFDSTWKAFSFDGVNDYISNTQTGYSQSGAYSVATWVRYDSLTSSDPCIFQYGNGSDHAGFGLIGYASEKRIRAFYYGNNAVDVNHIIELNKWMHLAAIYNTGNGQIHLYIDGQLVQSQTSGTSVTLDSTPHLSIGVQTDSSDVAINNTYFEGLIANFRLFNRALSSKEIWQLYAYQKDYFQVSPDVLTFKGGRLGIGTSEPTAALDVLGSVRMPGFSKVSAGGGYVYTNSRYVVHKFTTSGTFTILEPGLIEYIVVGGGGGGASRHSGGGGGGGVLVGTIYASKGDYVVTIGTGGSGHPGGTNNGAGNHGNPTRFAGLVALGGGGGGNDGGSATNIGCSGGTNVNQSAYAAQGYGVQGHLGGLGNSGPSQEGSYCGGGGGGAGGGGGDASPRGNVNNTSGGDGGPGRHIYGLGADDSDVYLGGGGGGDCAGVSAGNAGTGGIGGGGDGSKGVAQAGHGEANTGGGGGGAGFNNNLSPSNGAGGNGGSGVVYVRYLK